jgi:hypothetical protein
VFFPRYTTKNNQPILPHTYSLYCPGQELPAHQSRVPTAKDSPPCTRPTPSNHSTGNKIKQTVLYHRTPKFTSRSKLKEELKFDYTYKVRTNKSKNQTKEPGSGGIALRSARSTNPDHIRFRITSGSGSTCFACCDTIGHKIHTYKHVTMPNTKFLNPE